MSMGENLASPGSSVNKVKCGAGLPIKGDQFYPTVLRGPEAPEDFSQPLQLLAHSVQFKDPQTGQTRVFESQLQLQW